MEPTQLQLQLQQFPRKPGRNRLTVFFGALLDSTVASLNDAARQGAPVLYIYENHGGDPGPALRQSSLLYAPAGGRNLRPMLLLIFEYFGIEEGFQVNSLSQNGYEYLSDKYIPIFLQLLSDVKFNRHIGLLHLRCMLRNLPAMASANGLGARLRRHPAKALVCGAGPSLESQFELLRSRRDRFWLICVGHAARRLKEGGIEPDLVVEIDSESDRNWPPGLRFACPLATIPIIAPEVTTRFSRFLWYGEPDRENNKFLRGLGFDFPAVAVACGVIITALDVAFGLGFDEVGLIGSDLCLADNGSMYGDTVNFNPDRTMIPGNDGGMVASMPALTGIKVALEQYVAGAPGRICNCTKGGAVIAGTRRASLESFAGEDSITPKVEFHSRPSSDAALILAADWQKLMSGAPADDLSGWINDRLEIFVDRVRTEALQPEKLVTLLPELRADIDRDISGDAETGVAGPYRFSAFRRHAIAAVRLTNPQYADWLEQQLTRQGLPDFTVRSWLQSMPEVKLRATGQPLTSGDNREHVARENMQSFLRAANFDPACQVVVFAAPGDWQEVVQFAREFPGLPFAVLDPHPELFARIIEYSLFFHYFPENVLILGVNGALTRWARLYHGFCREVTRSGRQILLRTNPVLAVCPEVKDLLTRLQPE